MKTWLIVVVLAALAAALAVGLIPPEHGAVVARCVVEGLIEAPGRL